MDLTELGYDLGCSACGDKRVAYSPDADWVYVVYVDTATFHAMPINFCPVCGHDLAAAPVRDEMAERFPVIAGALEAAVLVLGLMRYIQPYEIALYKGLAALGHKDLDAFMATLYELDEPGVLHCPFCNVGPSGFYAETRYDFNGDIVGVAICKNCGRGYRIHRR